MPNVNTTLRYLPGAESNPHLVDVTRRFRARDNAEFFAYVAGELGKLARKRQPAGLGFDAGGVAAIGLTGGYGLLGYRLRRAQEVIRQDGGPSYWSHAFLIATPLGAGGARAPGRGRGTWVWECTLEPAAEFNLFADRNGASPRRLADYHAAEFEPGRPHCVPNVAVIALALTGAERRSILEYADNPDIDQLRYDLNELLAAWYAHVARPGVEPNPLTRGAAMPAAAYVQLAYDGAGIDLGLGAEQPNVTPEHIWQSVKYLGRWSRVTDEEGQLHPRAMYGWYCVRDRACLIAPEDRVLPVTLSEMTEAVTKPARGRKRRR